MPRSWNAKNRNEEIKKASSRDFDLVIIGGGITGAGIARECALRGISFCLLDKNDFAFGTSSRSSKLFHGGLRYLASGDFKLVRESTGERNWLLSHFPNLVRPLGFVYPAFERGKASSIKVRLAVFLYNMLSDSFSQFRNFRKGRILKTDYIGEIEPAVALEDPDLGNMTLAGFYYDTNCDDARVTLEIIKESMDSSQGASVALNYAQVENYVKEDRGRVKGVSVKDTLTGESFKVSGRCIVSAAGIWTDEVLSVSDYTEQRIYPTKGVHIVVPAERLGNRNAFSLVSFDDKRFFFVLKRGRVSIIGTTDTSYYPESKNLDEPWCSRADCDYLLRTVNRMFPHAMLGDNDIISTYAGIRPLIRQEGAKHESDLSRNHEIFQTPDGVVAIAGGKSTTHRRMAEDLLFYLVRHGYLDSFKKPEYRRRNFSKQPFKVGLTRKEFDRIAAEKELLETAHPEQISYFYTQFGRGAIVILEKIKVSPPEGKPLLDDYPHCSAEIDYILEYENAPKLIDVLCRRTEAQWMIWHHRQYQLAERVADIMAEYYRWSGDRKKTEIEIYMTYVNNNVRFLKTKNNRE